MKKTVALIAAMTITAMNFVSVNAKDTKSLQEMLALVKERVGDTSAYEKFTSDSFTENGEEVYRFEWYSDSDNYKSLNVTVDADGIITNYYCYEPEDYSERKPSLNTVTEKDAIKKAEEFIKIINPDIADSLKVCETGRAASLYVNDFYLNIRRYENGIPVYGDEGSICVSYDAAKVTNFYLEYNKSIDFADKDGIIAPESAWKALCENSGVEAEYVSKYNDNYSDFEIKAVYKPKLNYSQYIDAYDGSVKDFSDRSGSTRNAAMKEAMPEEAAADTGLGGFSPIEIEEIESIDGLLTEKEAENLLRQNELLDFEPKMETERISCTKERRNDRYIYNLNFGILDNNDGYYCYGYATMDAKSGELLSWSGYSDSSDYSDKKIDKEELMKVSEEYAKKLAGEKYHKDEDNEYRIEDGDYANKNYVQLARFVNGLKYSDDAIYIALNPENKKITSYRLSYTNKAFPSVENIISKDKAAECMNKIKDMELYYIPVYDIGAKKYTKAVLGYCINNLNECTIDAFTGEKFNEFDNERRIFEYSDIEGHYAKEAINTLAQYGVGFEGGKFEPDKIITQQEFAALLTSVFYNGGNIVLNDAKATQNSFKNIRSNNIIREEDGEPSDSLTKEKVAVYLVRMLGGEEIAKLDEIFVKPFDDVERNIGYISILKGMHILNGDGTGKFNPEKQMTRAGAVTVIYNYLKR